MAAEDPSKPPVPSPALQADADLASAESRQFDASSLDAGTVVEFVIRGLTHDDRPFRPSDWAERLCGVMSAFGSDGRMQYSPFVQPINAAGVKCVVVDIGLKEAEPMAWNFLLNFARDNELQVRPGRLAPRPPAEGAA
jgi:hypothetical protein